MIEKTRYESAVAEAELNLEQARLDHLQTENQVVVARRQFEREGTTPPNELSLRLPQLRVAERALAAAEFQLLSANEQLRDTTVTAPFSGFITERLFSLGQTVRVGEPLMHLAGNQLLEAVVELNPDDWALLERPIAGQVVRMVSREGQLRGRAVIRDGGGFLSGETRQPRIFLDIADTEDGVMSGEFVRFEFMGRRLTETITVPESALSRSGYIWSVSESDRLERFRPTILFRTDNSLTIDSPEGEGPWRIALTPLASFLPGLRVSPQVRGR
ncbi:MAG: HlyD family efflux transporter periplasmic adaptor subunit [Pseudomonadota bacterium]